MNKSPRHILRKQGENKMTNEQISAATKALYRRLSPNDKSSLDPESQTGYWEREQLEKAKKGIFGINARELRNSLAGRTLNESIIIHPAEAARFLKTLPNWIEIILYGHVDRRSFMPLSSQIQEAHSIPERTLMPYEAIANLQKDFSHNFSSGKCWQGLARHETYQGKNGERHYLDVVLSTGWKTYEIELKEGKR